MIAASLLPAWAACVSSELGARERDISRGQEPVPIPVDTRSGTGPPPFLYCARMPAQLPVITGLGCSCTTGSCSESSPQLMDTTPGSSRDNARQAAGCGCCGASPDSHHTHDQRPAIQQLQQGLGAASTAGQTGVQQPQGGDISHDNPDGSTVTSSRSTGHDRFTGAASATAPASAQLPPHGPGPPAELELIRECGPACACSIANCSRRATQQGVSVHVRVAEAKGKGWGVVAAQHIPAGSFVCQYVGELLSSTEAQGRLEAYDAAVAAAVAAGHDDIPGHALLAVRMVLPGAPPMRVNIDATAMGNVARFINHACDGGNLHLALVQQAGSLVPAVALFAARNIKEGEELLMSYGPPCGPPGTPSPEGSDGTTTEGSTTVDAAVDGSTSAAADAGHTVMSGHSGAAQAVAQPLARRCMCGTAACLGWLPRGGV